MGATRGNAQISILDFTFEILDVVYLAFVLVVFWLEALMFGSFGRLLC